MSKNAARDSSSSFAQALLTTHVMGIPSSQQPASLRLRQLSAYRYTMMAYASPNTIKYFFLFRMVTWQYSNSLDLKFKVCL